MAADTITCPHCGATEAKTTLESVATLTYRGRIQAEIDIAADIVEETATKRYEQKKVRVNKDGLEPTRDLASFRRDGDPYELDLIEWDEFDLDDEELVAFCWNCQGNVTDEFRALLDARVPIEGREPTDDEIYNRVGVEGGIAYTVDVPGSLGENDWRL